MTLTQSEKAEEEKAVQDPGRNLCSSKKPSAHLQVSLSQGELVEMQMYALCKQAFLLQVKSQFLESDTEETIKATPSL